MFKYPRTQHVQGSRLQNGDHDLEAVAWAELKGKHLIVEEKVDGANAGVSFEDGKLKLQSRGHFLRGGPRERHFDLLKQWASTRETELYAALGERYVMYGEWMFAKHTCFYDALPHYFMEFDVFDKEEKVFLSTPARDKLYTNAGIRDVVVPVRVLTGRQIPTLDELVQYVGNSYFKTWEWQINLASSAERAGVTPQNAFSHTDMSPKMEGLYVKWEDDHHVLGRYKYVRSSFTNSIMNQEEHWHDRPIIQNLLSPGAFGKMMSL